MLLASMGLFLLGVTGVLYWWGIPEPDQQSRVPQKWGMRSAFPGVVTCLGVAGLILVAKGLFP